jgi:hypothetical protein
MWESLDLLLCAGHDLDTGCADLNYGAGGREAIRGFGT